MYKLIKQSLIKSPKLFNFIKKYILKHYRNAQLKSTKFPRQVWIENTNHCNAECVMCPRDLHTRAKGIMSFDIYEKLIKEIASQKKHVDRVHMHNFGEPLLDKKIFERIKLAKDLGVRHVYFVTNASLLDHNTSKKIIESNLDEMKVSFYGVDKSSYNKTMVNLDFDKTLNNIREFFKIRKDLKSKNPTVVIQALPQNKHELSSIENWKTIFNDVLDLTVGDSLYISHLSNFGDGRQYVTLDNKIVKNRCRHPWREMVILQNGNVVPCCFDYNGTINLGNIKKRSIYEVWNGEQYKKIRKDFKRLNYDDYPICKKCDVPYS